METHYITFMTGTMILYINSRRYYIGYNVRSLRAEGTDMTAPHAKFVTRKGQETIKYSLTMQKQNVR